MSENNKLEEFLSQFANNGIKKRKSNEELGSKFQTLDNRLIKKKIVDFEKKDTPLFKTPENLVFNERSDNYKTSSTSKNYKLLNHSSPTKNEFKLVEMDDAEHSEKWSFPTLFSSPERHPSKIILDNNNSQKNSGFGLNKKTDQPTILNYYKERKKTLNSPPKNDINQNTPSKNDNFWSQYSISTEKFSTPKSSDRTLKPKNTQISNSPLPKKNTRKFPILKRSVGSKFSETILKNRQRQSRGIENYLGSFYDPQHITDDLRNSLTLKSVSQPSPFRREGKGKSPLVSNKFDNNFLQPTTTKNDGENTKQTNQFSVSQFFDQRFRKFNSLEHQKSHSQQSLKQQSWFTPPNSGSEGKKGSSNLPFSEGFDQCLDISLKAQLKIPRTQSLLELEQLEPDFIHSIKDYCKQNEAPGDKIINFDFKKHTTHPAPVNSEQLMEQSESLSVTNQNLDLNVPNADKERIDIEQIIVGPTFTQALPENCKQYVINTEKPIETNTLPNEPSQSIKDTETQSVDDTLKRKRSQRIKETVKQQKLETASEFTKNFHHYTSIGETSQNSQSEQIKNAKGYSLQKGSILYGDKLLQELLSDRNVIVKAYEKNMSKRKAEQKSEEILAKTCIKRYRRGNMKIYAIRKRYREYKRKNRFEHTFIDTLHKQIENDFQRVSSSEEDERRTISTPCSYLTDVTTDECDDLFTVSENTQLTDYQSAIRKSIDKLKKDENLIFSNFLDPAPKETDPLDVLATVYRIILQILGDYAQGLRPYFAFPSNVKANYVFNNNMYQLRVNPVNTKITHSETNTRFNLMLFILNKIRLLLENSTKLTKREIFYLLKTDITRQCITNHVIRNISRMIGVGCWDLNVTAQKGLVYGDLRLIISNGETINCKVPGTLIPIDINAICEVHSNAYFILVVEKESIFHKLIEEDLPSRLPRPFILITGKGFPDLGTQLFLKKLWMLMCIPVFIMVDADPDGISIMLTYRFGSISSAHLSDHLAIPKARWLGIFPSEIPKLNGDCTSHLKKEEKKKVARLLNLECVQSNQQIKREVEILQESGTKMGIEGLIKTQTYLSRRYLTLKFVQNDLI